MSALSTAVVVLAAGASTRLGRAKQLLPFEGQSLLRRAAEQAVAVGCDLVAVVIGAEADAMESELAGLDVVVVRNEDWAEGMASSVRAGLRACLSAEASLGRVLFTLCDQPAVDHRVLERLLRRHEQAGTSAAACSVRGRAQVPAVFGAAHFDELLALTGDEGARSILRRTDVEVARLEFEPADRDVDTPGDARSLEDRGR